MSLGLKAQTTTSQYCNTRFGYCISYPSNLIPQGQSQNGDGQSFLSQDTRAEVYTYGSNYDEEFVTIESEYKNALTQIKPTYKVKKQNWFIVSGYTKDGKIHYQKTKLSEDGASILTLTIQYNAEDQQQYATYCKLIAKF